LTSRDDILAKIRKARETDGPPGKGGDVPDERLKNHPAGIVPKGQDSAQDRRRLFVKKAEAAAASVDVVAPGGEAAAIAKWLRGHNLKQELRMGSDRRLASIKWPARGGPLIRHGPSDGADASTLSHAAAGIAETGTLVLASGPDNPTTLNFLAENHIVLVDDADIANDHESVWSRLRARYGEGKMPRTVNMITGPSRSADIEQTLILGAHGPIRLHIIVVARD
jgi:L-lactate dehydrogenase complex protein LldG